MTASTAAATEEEERYMQLDKLIFDTPMPTRSWADMADEEEEEERMHEGGAASGTVDEVVAVEGGAASGTVDEVVAVQGGAASGTVDEAVAVEGGAASGTVDEVVAVEGGAASGTVDEVVAVEGGAASGTVDEVVAVEAGAAIAPVAGAAAAAAAITADAPVAGAAADVDLMLHQCFDLKEGISEGSAAATLVKILARDGVRIINSPAEGGICLLFGPEPKQEGTKDVNNKDKPKAPRVRFPSAVAMALAASRLQRQRLAAATFGPGEVLVPLDHIKMRNDKYSDAITWAFSTHVIVSTREVANSEELSTILGDEVLVLALTDVVDVDRRLVSRAQERNLANDTKNMSNQVVAELAVQVGPPKATPGNSVVRITDASLVDLNKQDIQPDNLEQEKALLHARHGALKTGSGGSVSGDGNSNGVSGATSGASTARSVNNSVLPEQQQDDGVYDGKLQQEQGKVVKSTGDQQQEADASRRSRRQENKGGEGSKKNGTEMSNNAWIHILT